jgi:ABC-2 type transport system permease protein
MNALTMAEKEFHDARRSRTLLALIVLFGILGVSGPFLYTKLLTMQAPTEPITSRGFVMFMAEFMALFVSLSAILLGYKAIAGETESGSGKLLLSLPNHRRDIVLGKLIGRGTTFAVPLFLSGLGMCTVGWFVIPGLDPVELVVFTIATIIFGVSFLWLIIGLSAMTKSSGRAATYALGAFVLLEMLWNIVVIASVYVENGFSFPGEAGTTVVAPYLQNLPPGTAYHNLLEGSLAMASGTAHMTPFESSLWFAASVLVGWAVVSPLGGYLRFDSIDL